MTVLITGAGLLGHAVAVAAAAQGSQVRVVGSRVMPQAGSAWQCDLASVSLPDEAVEGVDLVVHTFALADVSACERHPDVADHYNVAVTQRVVQRAAEAGARVVYPSTDWVFDGTRGGYAEGATPKPVNAYARSKARGEQVVTAFGGLVLRGAFMGRRPDGRSGLVEALGDPATPHVGRRRITNPCAVTAYADMLIRLATLAPIGPVHLGSSEPASWTDICRAIRRAVIDRDDVAPATEDGIARPYDTSLATDLAMGLLSRRMPTLKETLQGIADQASVFPTWRPARPVA
jgi:dTDP-4-dehydrorhamnose reductase